MHFGQHSPADGTHPEVPAAYCTNSAHLAQGLRKTKAETPGHRKDSWCAATNGGEDLLYKQKYKQQGAARLPVRDGTTVAHSTSRLQLHKIFASVCSGAKGRPVQLTNAAAHQCISPMRRINAAAHQCSSPMARQCGGCVQVGGRINRWYGTLHSTNLGFLAFGKALIHCRRNSRRRGSAAGLTDR